MLTDLLLAALHHLFVFALVARLASEAMLLSGTVDGATIQRIARIDAGYGAVAGLLLVVGLLRVWFGLKGPDFYLHNPWFHAKLGVYVLVGLLSILPTVTFLRWRRALRTDPAFVPDAGRLGRARTLVRLQLAAVLAVFLLAAAMARYGGF
jgi:putative membrane protein